MPQYSVQATYTFATRGIIEAESEEDAEVLLLRQARREMRDEIKDSDGGCIDTFIQEVEE